MNHERNLRADRLQQLLRLLRACISARPRRRAGYRSLQQRWLRCGSFVGLCGICMFVNFGRLFKLQSAESLVTDGMRVSARGSITGERSRHPPPFCRAEGEDAYGAFVRLRLRRSLLSLTHPLLSPARGTMPGEAPAASGWSCTPRVF
jgi:hypothetical protein